MARTRTSLSTSLALASALIVAPTLLLAAAGDAPEQTRPSDTPKTDSKKADQKEEESGRGFGRAIGDASITTAVKTALAGAKDVKAHNINVDTYKGVVTLKGVVQNKAERKKAVHVASSVAGVKKVIDKLVIQP